MPSLEPKPLVVAPKGPTGAFMVELLIYNGSPFNDHWAYWVRSQANRDIGVMIDAIGNVREGFSIRRSHSFEPPTKKIPLQWVDGKHFDEKAMLNHGKQKIDNALVCGFETSVYKVKAPGKSLNAVNDGVTPGKKIAQRDCQTWIVESADQLVKDHIFSPEVADYLHAIKQ